MTVPANVTTAARRLRRVGAQHPRRHWPLTMGWALAFIAGCATQAPVTFHTLLPLERPAAVSREPGPVVRLEPVRVPEAVDQPQWLIRRGDGTLAQLERERWASPPSQEIAQALREVLRLGFNISEAPGAHAAGGQGWRLRVDVLRFESLPEEARFEVIWTVTTAEPGTAAVLRCTSYFREPATGGLAALGEAHRRAVSALGSVLGRQLLALHRDPRAGCPG